METKSDLLRGLSCLLFLMFVGVAVVIILSAVVMMNPPTAALP